MNNNTKEGEDILRMPYGEFKGYPFSEVPDYYFQWLMDSSHDNFYVHRQELLRRENKEPEPANPPLMFHGSYKGQLLTKVPTTYVRYLVNEAYKAYHAAKNELEKRSLNPELSVSPEVPETL